MELKAAELAIRRVELAAQEQRNVGLRLELERDRDRRRAREQEHEQQPPVWDAALERQKLRIEEATLRIDEQHARLELARLQRQPSPAPPSSVASAAADATPTPEQFRAISAALQVKHAQVRIGKADPLIDSVLFELGAVNREVAIAEETRKQETLKADLRAVEEQRRLAPSKVIPVDPAAVVKKIRERAELEVRASKGDKDYSHLQDKFTVSALQGT